MRPVGTRSPFLSFFFFPVNRCIYIYTYRLICLFWLLLLFIRVCARYFFFFQGLFACFGLLADESNPSFFFLPFFFCSKLCRCRRLFNFFFVFLKLRCYSFPVLFLIRIFLLFFFLRYNVHTHVFFFFGFLLFVLLFFFSLQWRFFFFLSLMSPLSFLFLV